MFKRTKGYLLLTLLILTGLAGNTDSNLLSGNERKTLVNHLKDSKAALIKSVKGLSEAQLNFKAGADKWSIKECVYHITISETNLWKMAEAQLKQPANPEKRNEIKITDDVLVKMMTDRSKKFQAPETFRPEQAKWKSVDEAMDEFKDKRNDLIKNIKTSTQDMRNHVAQSPMGFADSYQLLLMISAHTIRHTKQIEEVKADPNFPK